MSSANASNLDPSEILSFGKELNRLFTEKVAYKAIGDDNQGRKCLRQFFFTKVRVVW